MEQIYTPAIVVNLRDFRKYPAEWYQTWNTSGDGEYGLHNKSQGLKHICQYRWDNSIERLKFGAGWTFPFAINKDKFGYEFMVWDDARGLIISVRYQADDDGHIPAHVIKKIGTELTRWVRGFTDCRQCGCEMKWLEAHGMYYDSRYCSKECADLNLKAEHDRSK